MFIDQSEIDTMINDYRQQLKDGKRVAYNIIKPEDRRAWEVLWEDYFNSSWLAPYESAITQKHIKKLNKKLQAIPNGFELHPRVKKMLSERQKMADGKINADWGFAETLAYASLAEQGTSIRLSGQDTGRGHFFFIAMLSFTISYSLKTISLFSTSAKIKAEFKLLIQSFQKKPPLDLSMAMQLRIQNLWLYGKLNLETLLMAPRQSLTNLLPPQKLNGVVSLT